MVGEFLSPYLLSRWILRQDYPGPLYPAVRGRRDRDPGSRRGPGCCAASRVDRLRWAVSRRRWAWRASRARRAWPASVIRSRMCSAASCRSMSGCMVSSLGGVDLR